MLGWTNLAQGAGASLSPLLAALVVDQVGVKTVLISAFVLRFFASFVLSGKIFAGDPQPQAEPTA
jgi:hypothetical protein